MMKLTIALIFAFLSTTVVYGEEPFNYSCNACLFPGIISPGIVRGDPDNHVCDVVVGKTYPLRVYEDKNVLEWRGKKYSLTQQPDCGKYGWHAEGNGTSFDFCTATKGYAAIQDKDGNALVQCDLKR